VPDQRILCTEPGLTLDFFQVRATRQVSLLTAWIFRLRGLLPAIEYL
jgi:hypothetical protein